ncbi:MAG: hypothetical protein QME87_11960 [Bacillota bacterium]|nr:hypothetical protein [Bacillota bacterium]
MLRLTTLLSLILVLSLLGTEAAYAAPSATLTGELEFTVSADSPDVEATCAVQVENTGGDPLTQVRLVFPTETVQNVEVTSAGQPLPCQTDRSGGSTRLVVSLPSPLSPGDKALVKLGYRLSGATNVRPEAANHTRIPLFASGDGVTLASFQARVVLPPGHKAVTFLPKAGARVTPDPEPAVNWDLSSLPTYLEVSYALPGQKSPMAAFESWLIGLFLVLVAVVVVVVLRTMKTTGPQRPK